LTVPDSDGSADLMVENFLQALGEEALKSLPLTVAVGMLVLFSLGVIYKGLTGASKEAVIIGAVMLLVSLALVERTWNEAAEICGEMRDTDFWAENNCDMVDPEGRRLPAFDPTP
jgi:hypothetical protein